ncbi:uncharacterized protein STEHIDRAFT_164777 [Stereum hirsutum FP-91666 SS1]|uniref:uncharacterized protein n=1 Tax=Stereum hirsutum (strain FP-91666) TaxID=721885 RepID=UPI000440B3E3|nr:uncharacterized protein STEHIDRAFT_164777 [Stereum hirsutum FP-91666 SS1]EIM92512.1 hypothetical protein STEHIDRAFT_164777 [Stereum hirsutum FP-91666 SS1]
MASNVNEAPLPDLRRIVTGHDLNGKAVVQSDAGIPTAEFKPGITAAALWVTHDMPSTDNNSDVDGATRPLQGMAAPGGTNFRYTDLAPGAVTPMHRTISLDYNILLQGEVVLIMEDGEERHLTNAGDTVIQKATMHAWRNPGKTWARWATVVVDAVPPVVNGETLQEEWRD